MLIKASQTINTVIQRSHWKSLNVQSKPNRFPQDASHPSQNLAWLRVMDQAFGHRTMVIEAQAGGQTVGILPLAEVKSILFGKFLVSLPYLNAAGVWAESTDVALSLIDRAVQLADELNVRYLELRNETEFFHPKLSHRNATKALMRLALPSSAEALWSQFKSKLRSQIRSGERNHYSVDWGGAELLDGFYKVFSQKMHELGTPVYSRKMFSSILEYFPGSAEFCCVSWKNKPVAVALLVHGKGITEVPSASSLSEFNSKNANMFMYWQLLQRAIARGNRIFDFGRSTIDSNTYRFKKQWGAKPSSSIWQYYLRKGKHDAMRPESGRFSLATATWRHLPLSLTKWIGPMIVRGIP